MKTIENNDISTILRQLEENRKEPSDEEAEILLKAQGEIIKAGNTSISCPRCGKQLELRIGSRSGGTSIYCLDYNCIILNCRGI